MNFVNFSEYTSYWNNRWTFVYDEKHILLQLEEMRHQTDGVLKVILLYIY